MAKVTVDTTELEKLGKDMRAGSIIALGRLAERGGTLLRKEIPYKTGNLKQGVAPPEIDRRSLKATLTVSARSARSSATTGIVHYPSGKTKTVALKPQIAFNYAEVVARGRPAIRPKTGRALIIEVDGAPSTGAYISAGGKIYVVRMSARAQKPNPFDERAAEQLGKESPAIVGEVFGEIFNRN